MAPLFQCWAGAKARRASVSRAKRAGARNLAAIGEQTLRRDKNSALDMGGMRD
jgi:hypothetical protein